MARIPTLNIPQVQRAPVAGVPMDLQSALAPSRGKMAIAQGIGQLGQVAGQFATRKAQAREEATVSDTNRKLNAYLEEFEAESAKSPDPATWQGLWDAKVKAAQGDINEANKKLGTTGKQRVDRMFKDWSVLTGTKVKTKIALGEVAEDRMKFTTASMAFYEKGERELGDAEIAKAASAGTMSPQQEAAWYRKGAEVSDNAKAKAAINKNPFVAKGTITKENYPNLTEDDILTLNNHARNQVESARYENMRSLDDELQNILEGSQMAGDWRERVSSARKAEYILADQERDLVSRLEKKNNPEEDVAFATSLWDMADVLDANAPDFKRNAMAISAAAIRLPPAMRERIIGTITDKQNIDSKKDYPKEAIAALDGMLKNGGLGLYDLRASRPWEIERKRDGSPRLDANNLPIYKYDEFGKPIVNEKERQKQYQEYLDTMKFYGDVKARVIDFAKANPKLPPSKIMEFMEDLTRGRTTLMGSRQIYSTVSGMANAQEEDDGNE